MTDPFIHLHVHSDYSLLEGAIKVQDVVQLAKKNNMPAVALTDVGNLFGALEFALDAAAAGVQPIIGCEIKLKRPNNDQIDKLVLLVQSELGYKNLLKLMTCFYFKNGDDPHITLDQLQQYAGGLIALSGSTDGWIGQLVLGGHKEAAEGALETFLNIFADRFYLEITRHGTSPEIKIEQDILDLALKHNVPIVATNNVYFSTPDMYEAHDALICVAGGRYVNEEDRPRFTPHHYFKTDEEMRELFKDLPEAIANTSLIAKRCAYMPTTSGPLLPAFPAKDGRCEEEELELQARDGLENRLKTHVFKPSMSEDEKEALRQTYQKRLEYELGIIKQMGFPGYFLIVADFIKWAKSQNIPVGPGRGSGAGSVVAWSLTITDVDPIRFNLLFERFLNPERVSMPDFDIDFCQDRRDEVIQYVQNLYGSARVAHIITFGKLQARAVLRDVGRVLQMPYGQVDRICKMIPNNPAAPVTLEEALAQDTTLQVMREQDESVAKLMDIALKLEGLYRHASTHAAGVIIGDMPLDERIPLYKDPKSSIAVTQFSMKYVEKAGLVKFDFLGLKTLTVVEHAAHMARQKKPSLQVATLPLDDTKTFELLRRVETTGVFQLESTGMRDVLRKLKPDKFEEIIALVALYRPGPMDDIPRYLACKHGEEKVRYAHPMLEDILKETFGVMVYQEQVMQIAQKMGGYSMGGADLLRRAMGKKIHEEMAAQRKTFIEGAVQNGVDQSLAHTVFDQMAKFASYGFNKSHSAPYGLIAYQTAYMKANYPVEFMAATMTYDMSNTDKLNMYREELRSMEIPLLPPDVNHSNTTFAVEGGAVRYGLAAIKNVGAAAMSLIIEEREQNGPFKSIQDFLERVDSKVLNKRQMEHLIMAGAFDTLNPNRRQLFESLDLMVAHGIQMQADKNSRQKSLFGDTGPKVNLKLADLPDWDLSQKLQNELEAFGFYLSSHPLDAYELFMETGQLVPSNTIQQHKDRTVRMGGIVTAFKERVSKAGRKFAFVTLTDQFGTYEVMLFSDVLTQARPLLDQGHPLCLDVQVREDPERGLKLLALGIKPLEGVLKPPRVIEVQVRPSVDMETLTDFIKSLPKGQQSIILHLELEDLKTAIVTLDDTYSLTVRDIQRLKSLPGVLLKS